MSDVNSLSISGRLTRKADAIPVGDRFVVRFSIASGFSVKKDGEWKDETLFLECDYWCKSDNILKLLDKGTQVFVSGALRIDKFMAKDGTEKAKTKCLVNSVSVGRAGKGGGDDEGKESCPF